MDREIITVQAGNYANYVCCHWWNIQRSYFTLDSRNCDSNSNTNNNNSELNHKKVFRETRGDYARSQPTYFPRAVVLDLKGSLHASPDGSVPDPEQSMSEEVNVFRSEPHVKNVYQSFLDEQRLKPANAGLNVNSMKDFKLEKHVESWTDFLAAPYHTKSTQLVTNYHATDGNMFRNFNAGCSEFNSDATFENVEDSLRFFAEECDSLQGFQVVSDIGDAFAGVASELVTHLRDEFGGKTIICAATWEGHPPSSLRPERHLQLLNVFCALSRLSSACDLLIPMSLANSLDIRDELVGRKFNHVNYEIANKYTTSAILASAFDLVSLPYRCAQNDILMSDLCNGINRAGHRIAAASVVLPYDDSLPTGTDTDVQCLFPSLAPGKREGVITQHNCYRGAHDWSVEVLSKRRKSPQLPPSAAVCDVFGMDYENCRHTRSEQLLPTLPPYPQLFASEIGETGQMLNNKLRPSHKIVRSVACASSLTTSTDMLKPLTMLLDHTQSSLSSKFFSTGDNGFEPEQLNDALEDFRSVIANYEP